MAKLADTCWIQRRSVEREAQIWFQLWKLNSWGTSGFAFVIELPRWSIKQHRTQQGNVVSLDDDLRAWMCEIKSTQRSGKHAARTKIRLQLFVVFNVAKFSPEINSNLHPLFPKKKTRTLESLKSPFCFYSSTFASSFICSTSTKKKRFPSTPAYCGEEDVLGLQRRWMC